MATFLATWVLNSGDLISLVEKLHIIGPCSLQFRPVMESLKEVKVSPIQGGSRAMSPHSVCCLTLSSVIVRTSLSLLP